MSMGPISQCSRCTHFRSPFSREDGDFSGGPFCVAFPDGIPQPVLRNQRDHRAPIDGDHGVRWASDGRPFPEDAFEPENLADI